MNSKYVFETATDFKKFLVKSFGVEMAKALYCVFTRLQAKFQDDKIIAHNISILALQGEQPYMIETIILDQFAGV